MNESNLLIGYSQIDSNLVYDRLLSMEGIHPRVLGWIRHYYDLGRRTGIRPEVLIAQALFETGRGHFNGKVPVNYHNLAGIKIPNPGDQDIKEDHQIFPNWEDGIRAHVNHMCAYTGNRPIGRPHGRYHIVKKLGWAGSIATIDELSGKWAPRPDYHTVLVDKFLNPLMS